MLYWNRFPFIRICLSFGAGIVSAGYFQPSLYLKVAVFLAFAFYLCTEYFLRKYYHPDLFTLTGILAFTVFFSLGILSEQNQRTLFRTGFILKKTSNVSFYYAEITAIEGMTDKSQKVIARIHLVSETGRWQNTRSKLLLYIPKNVPVLYGDYILVKGQPSVVKGPLNPYEFDYKKYLFRQGIAYTQFLRPGQFKIIKNKRGNLIIYLAYAARNSIKEIIIRNIDYLPVRGILIALTTGYRDQVDENTSKSFGETGIMHILAVSGLHVGIIYLLLMLILKPLSASRAGIWFRTVIIMIVLLLFVFITGLTPSVLRAALMFSLILIGITIERNSHILNSVFLSAFILLLINPYFLYDVGFQLSYGAVIGIIIGQPVVFRLWIPKRFLLYRIWELASVSIAAQLATLPLTLYYFKKFPVYFLPANLIAIPVVSIIIPGTVILLVFSHFNFIAHILAFLVTQFGRSFLSAIDIIRNLPGSSIGHVSFDPVQSLLLILLVYSIIFILYFKKAAWFYVAAFSLLILICIDASRYLDVVHQCKVVIYDVPGHTCLELLEGNRGILVSDAIDPAGRKRIGYRIQNYCIRKAHKHIHCTFNNTGNIIPGYENDGIQLICWNRILLGILHKRSGIKVLMHWPASLDILIIDRNVIVGDKINMLKRKAKKIIWDSKDIEGTYATGILGKEPIENAASHGGFQEIRIKDLMKKQDLN